MGQRKSPKRIVALGSSIRGCFGGSVTGNCSSFPTPYKPHESLFTYDRLEARRAEASQPVLKLGSATFSSESGVMKVMSNPSNHKHSTSTLAAKCKGAYDKVLDAVRRSGPHINDLFVGNLLLMQVTAVSLSRGSKNPVPSRGLFVGITFQPTDSPLHEV